LKFAAASTPYALGCHSAGGPVVYRCLDLLSDLVQDPKANEIIASSARSWLPADEGRELADALSAVRQSKLQLPVAVISFEGTLLHCDVEGWADDWAKSDKEWSEDWIRNTFADPYSQWTWPLSQACCGSLWERCKKDEPARHLASIKQWLQLPNSPGLIYAAGAKSSKRNQHIFPALRTISDSCGKKHKMLIEEVKDAGHNLSRDKPESVKAIIDKALSVTRGIEKLKVNEDTKPIADSKVLLAQRSLVTEYSPSILTGFTLVCVILVAIVAFMMSKRRFIKAPPSLLG
jgi:pimeloyl-ACP methyl ester carboxylesterase